MIPVGDFEERSAAIPTSSGTVAKIAVIGMVIFASGFFGPQLWSKIHPANYPTQLKECLAKYMDLDRCGTIVANWAKASSNPRLEITNAVFGDPTLMALMMQIGARDLGTRLENEFGNTKQKEF